MPKYYIQCGPERAIFNTDSQLEACAAVVIRILDRDEDQYSFGPFMIVSEAGFSDHIEKWGDPETADEYFFSTSTILRMLDLDEIADGLDKWCKEQNDPCLNSTLDLLRHNGQEC